ncbi:hypothetical protein GCM10010307_22270 [Streptomyces vastus]|uniref:Uncharacterized protein n=1 Tax=Streptomyces vastus TaxID=285451 RepID=A0ABN3QNF7_9ACTN
MSPCSAAALVLDLDEDRQAAAGGLDVEDLDDDLRGVDSVGNDLRFAVDVELAVAADVDLVARAGVHGVRPAAWCRGPSSFKGQSERPWLRK